MILIDVNVLLALHRLDHPHHEVVQPWFEDARADTERFAVPDSVWASFLRIATNRRIFDTPTPLTEAFAFVRAVRAQPNYLRVETGASHVDIFEETCIAADATGTLVADAYLAAIAIEQGAVLVSLDRDFARFDRLRWKLPTRS